MRLVFRYQAMQDIVDFALSVLRERSPVGTGNDKHPGLYRDSHTVFLNGHVVQGADVSAFRPGDQINISNPVPYARKIEIGRLTMSVPPHVYEDSALIVAGRYGNRASVKFTFMPVRFGGVAAFAAFSKQIRPGRRMSEKARQDWLSRQPALEIRAR
ncbi:hypothetical protein [Bradyrhizobium cosmicum]|uniref:Uncharacterized protein n=1 Tax=Bradyrhizobium cosmicum TaxID=1404864 RepID=A0AAI8QC70_9BRAD|nr:hypothetical protein [Bradyrhizobium cosmicum]BAL77032.1 hypothetical protein S23_38370 [Bradyrhizobium cosmicum]